MNSATIVDRDLERGPRSDDTANVYPNLDHLVASFGYQTTDSLPQYYDDDISSPPYDASPAAHLTSPGDVQMPRPAITRTRTRAMEFFRIRDRPLGFQNNESLGYGREGSGSVFNRAPTISRTRGQRPAATCTTDIKEFIKRDKAVTILIGAMMLIIASVVAGIVIKHGRPS